MAKERLVATIGKDIKTHRADQSGATTYQILIFWQFHKKVSPRRPSWITLPEASMKVVIMVRPSCPTSLLFALLCLVSTVHSQEIHQQAEVAAPTSTSQQLLTFNFKEIDSIQYEVKISSDPVLKDTEPEDTVSSKLVLSWNFQSLRCPNFSLISSASWLDLLLVWTYRFLKNFSVVSSRSTSVLYLHWMNGLYIQISMGIHFSEKFSFVWFIEF